MDSESGIYPVGFRPSFSRVTDIFFAGLVDILCHPLDLINVPVRLTRKALSISGLISYRQTDITQMHAPPPIQPCLSRLYRRPCTQTCRPVSPPPCYHGGPGSSWEHDIGRIYSAAEGHVLVFDRALPRLCKEPEGEGACCRERNHHACPCYADFSKFTSSKLGSSLGGHDCVADEAGRTIGVEWKQGAAGM